jgi:hypothetical protein
MRRLLYRSTFLSLLTVLSVAPSVQAAPGCSNRDFSGVYGMIAKGNILGVILPAFNPTIGPVIRVSRVVADGNGNVMADSNASYNGFFLHELFAGTYTIASDCTIRYDLVVPLPFICASSNNHPACAGGDSFVGVPVPFVFVGSIVEGGADIAIALASPNGATVRVHLQRQRLNPLDAEPVCSAKDLSGIYQVDMDGSVIDQAPLLAGPFTRAGSLTFDGKGAFSGTTFTNYVYSGAATKEVLTGTYSVTTSCTFTMSYALGGHTYGWLGVLTHGGLGANVMVSSPTGAVIGGTLLKAVDLTSSSTPQSVR